MVLETDILAIRLFVRQVDPGHPLTRSSSWHTPDPRLRRPSCPAAFFLHHRALHTLEDVGIEPYFFLRLDTKSMTPKWKN